MATITSKFLLKELRGGPGTIYRDREGKKEGWGEFRNQEFV